MTLGAVDAGCWGGAASHRAALEAGVYVSGATEYQAANAAPQDAPRSDLGSLMFGGVILASMVHSSGVGLQGCLWYTGE